MEAPDRFLPADHPDLHPINAREAMKFNFYQSLRTLTADMPTCSLTPYEFKVFSHNGEDGVTLEILNRIGVQHEYFVEFGGEFGRECNTRILSEALGWHGLMMERDNADFARLERSIAGREHKIQLMHTEVTPENFTGLLHEASVPQDFDVLSIDVDGPDYYIWRGLEEFTPRMVIIEYNGSLPQTPLAQRRDDPGWQGTSFFGASIEAMIELGSKKGYSLAHTELCGLNAFFVRDDLFPLLGELQVPRRAMNFNLMVGGHPPDTTGRTYVVPPK